MLATAFRFHGHNAVRSVYRKGRAVRNGLGSLHVLRDERRSGSRSAVVVSRKVHKSAVRRNRIRRRIYEIIRQEGALPPGTSLVLTVYTDTAADMPHAELRAQVRDLLAKARLG